MSPTTDYIERVNRAIDHITGHLDAPRRLDDQPCFEAWHGRPYADGAERFRVRVQLPVVPAA